LNHKNTLQALITKAKESIEQNKMSLPEDWEQVRGEVDRWNDVRSDLNIQAEAARLELSETKKALKNANSTYERLQMLDIQRTTTLETNKKTLGRDQDNLKSQIKELPKTWQSEAYSLTSEKCESFGLELNNLRGYEDLHQRLDGATHSKADLETRRISIRSEIDAFPSEAKRPAKEIECELAAAREEKEKAQTSYNQSQNGLVGLLEQQCRFTETEQKTKDASRKALLYGILNDKLGENGIQREIIREAEKGIVQLANQILDNLSGGRSQLKLREGDGNKKALDLEIWDSQTGGGKPLLVGLASGSQRFRIAISLALGIGQYIGHESNRIESVIIDEGFGSLDREGRESVIQEFYNLREHLKRIILVSHQEEFSRGFTTGYEIRLVDGASQVRPLVQ